jgi:hypothetical protein
VENKKYFDTVDARYKHEDLTLYTINNSVNVGTQSRVQLCPSQTRLHRTRYDHERVRWREFSRPISEVQFLQRPAVYT